jgi:acetoin utilization deacetylase AcuC-like enzyme
MSGKMKGIPKLVDNDTEQELATSRMKVFFNERYVAPTHSFDTTRKAKWIIDKLEADRSSKEPDWPNLSSLIEIIDPVGYREKAEKLIIETHDQEYVDALVTGNPRKLSESQGFEWDPGIWEMSVNSTAGIIAAVHHVTETEGQGETVNAGSLSSGLHHARSHRGSGYCTVNGLAIGALAARDIFLKSSQPGSVVVLDVDAHCGGGTHSFIGQSEQILHLDLSVNAFDSYEPMNGNNLTVLNSPSGKEYLSNLSDLFEKIPSDTKLLLYNAGMDPYPTVGQSLLERREDLVSTWCEELGIPVVFVLAGGYLGAFSKSELVAAHMYTIKAFSSNQLFYPPRVTRNRDLPIEHLMLYREKSVPTPEELFNQFRSRLDQHVPDLEVK